MHVINVISVNRAQNIILRYPNYIATYHGICKGPEGSEHLGCCTQMAVFHRVGEKEEVYSPGIENLFKVVARYEYPFQIDNRSDEEKIVDEASYYIRHLSYQDDMEEEVPLKLILKMLHTFPITMDELETILGDAGWAIEEREDGPVVLVPPPTTYSDTTVGGPLWSNDMYASEEDEWNMESEQPINYSRDRQEESDNEDWDVESSIVIPAMSQNNSTLEDNTYLYDENDVLHSNEFETTRSAEVPDKYSEINNEGNIDSILGTDNFNKSFDNNDPLYLNESTELSDSPVTRKLKSLYITSDIQDDAISDTAQKLNCTLDLVYMSLSRASTSPEPYLLHAVKMDQQLTNDSICNQSMSDHWMLNNSLQQENISINTIADVNDEESKKSSLKYDLDGHDHLNDIYSNTLYKEDKDSDNDTNTAASTNPIDLNQMQSIQQSSNVSEHNCHLKDQLQSDNSIVSVNDIVTDNQPQFTSSPKIETRASSVGKKRRSLDFKEEENNTNSLNISQKCQFTSPGSNNSRNEVLLQSNIDTNITAMSGIKPNTIGKRYGKQDTSMYQNDTKVKSGNELIKNFDQDTLNSSDTATICPTLDDNKQTIEELPETNSLSSNNGTKSNEILQREITDPSATEKLVKEEKELPAINKYNIQSVNCDTKIQLTKNSINEKTDLKSELHNDHDLRSVVTEMFCNDAKDTRDIESTSVLKNEKQDECSVENRELKPSPETVETPSSSWSPEVIDSGYPNSASAQDMTQEYALSSIAQGHISDSESPNIAEVLRPEIPDEIEVENGDLANNNRDGEGNNMIAAELNELEDLQPFIEVLENDIENENDIYGIENDFPIWLLGILNMANPIDVDIGMQNHRELMFPNRAAGNFISICKLSIKIMIDFYINR